MRWLLDALVWGLIWGGFLLLSVKIPQALGRRRSAEPDSRSKHFPLPDGTHIAISIACGLAASFCWWLAYRWFPLSFAGETSWVRGILLANSLMLSMGLLNRLGLTSVPDPDLSWARKHAWRIIWVPYAAGMWIAMAIIALAT